MSDNNFMKVVKERNPYLRRVSSDNPHKYSYTMHYTAMISIQANIIYKLQMENKLPLIKLELSALNFTTIFLDSQLLICATKRLKKTQLLFILHQISIIKRRIHTIHPWQENLWVTVSSLTKWKGSNFLNFSQTQMTRINSK